MIGVEIANPSEFVGIGFPGVKAFQDNDLIGLDSGGFVDGSRIEAPEPEVGFGPGDKKGQCLMDSIKAIEIQIPTVDDVKGSWFEDQLIQDGDVVNFAMSNDNEGGNTSPEVQESVQFHSGFVGSEFGPRKKRQTQIDGGGIQGIGRLVQFDTEGIVDVEATRLANEDLGKVRIDSPIPDLIGMSEGVAGDVASKTHMIEFSLSRTETGFDVSEALPISKLSKGHAEKLIQAGEGLHLVVAVVPLHAFSKFVGGEELHQLSKDGFADIHICPSPSVGVRKYGLSA